MPIGNAFIILKSGQSPKNAIVITDQPDNTTLNIGENLTLSLNCVGTFPISARWRKNNTNFRPLSVVYDGAINLGISNVQITDEGNYDCVLTNIVGTVTSNKASFIINKPPTFTVNPININGYVGGSFTFTSNATGTGTISYQWIKQNSGNINGATSNSYTLDNITFSNSGKYACIASNLYGTITSTFASLSVRTLIPIIANNIAAGAYNNFFLGTTGTVSACGNNNNGTLGDGTRTNRLTAVKINLPPVSEIFSVFQQTYFLGTDSTVSACGNNARGQLGDGTTTNRSTPIKINLTQVSTIACGYEHTLLLGSDGTLSACGQNTNGQLGDGTTTNRSTPIKINLPPVAMIGAGGGYYESFAIGTDGLLSAWGSGISTPFKPTEQLPPITMIATGTTHALFLGTDGTVSACGNNSYGQLGDGTTSNRSTLIKINLPPVAMIAAGGYHSLALGTDGGLSAWGDNTDGQLGDGTTTNRLIPVKINLTQVKKIAAGDYHSLFLKTNNTVFGCGNNIDGQFGDGTTTNRLTPIIIGY